MGNELSQLHDGVPELLNKFLHGSRRANHHPHPGRYYSPHHCHCGSDGGALVLLAFSQWDVSLHLAGKYNDTSNQYAC